MNLKVLLTRAVNSSNNFLSERRHEWRGVRAYSPEYSPLADDRRQSTFIMLPIPAILDSLITFHLTISHLKVSIYILPSKLS